MNSHLLQVPMWPRSIWAALDSVDSLQRCCVYSMVTSSSIDLRQVRASSTTTVESGEFRNKTSAGVGGELSIFATHARTRWPVRWDHMFLFDALIPHLSRSLFTSTTFWEYVLLGFFSLPNTIGLFFVEMVFGTSNTAGLLWNFYFLLRTGCCTMTLGDSTSCQVLPHYFFSSILSSQFIRCLLFHRSPSDSISSTSNRLT